VTTADPEQTYQALEKYSVDLTALAREGKIDPVIGRDIEIRRVKPRPHINLNSTTSRPTALGGPSTAPAVRNNSPDLVKPRPHINLNSTTSPPTAQSGPSTASAVRNNSPDLVKPRPHINLNSTTSRQKRILAVTGA